MAISADGQSLAAAGGQANKGISIWGMQDGRLRHVLQGHTSCVVSIAFGAGNTLASAADDKSVKVWDTESGTLVRTIELGDNAATAVLVDSKRRRLTVAVDDVIQIRNLDGTLIREITTGLTRIRTLTASSDGTAVAAAGPASSGHGVVELWDVSTFGLMQRTEAPPAGVYTGTIRTDGKIMASAGDDRSIRLWDSATGVLLRTLDGHKGRFGWVFALAFSPDGTLIASGGEDRSVKIWSSRDGRLLQSFEEHTRAVEAVAFSPDGKTLAAGGLGVDGDVDLWDMASGVLGRSIPAKTAGRTTGDSHEDRNAVASFKKGWHLKEACGFEVTSMDLTFSEHGSGKVAEILQEAMAGTAGTVRGIAFSPDGQSLASATLDRFIRVWNPTSGKLTRDFVAHKGVVRTVAFSPDGSVIASAGTDRQIRLWDPRTGYLQRQLTGHTGTIYGIAFSPDGKRIASTANDRTTRLWDTRTGAVTQFKGDHRGWALAFSNGGSMLALASWENEIVLFDGAGAVLRTIKLEASPVSLAFSDHDHLLIVGRDDGKISVIDVATGTRLREMDAHSGPVWSLSYAPGSGVLASAGADTTVRIWRPETGELLVTLMEFDRGQDWLVITPDGLFDGSPGGWTRVRWRFSEERFDTAPVEAFFAEFYHPGLLADVMARGRVAPPREIAQLDRRGPSVTLTMEGATTANTTIRVRVKEAPAAAGHSSGGVRDLRVFRNGSLVRVWRGDLLKEGKSETTVDASVALVAGQNHITAYAFNRDNVKSADASLFIDGATSLETRARAWVLVIGVDRYSNRDYDLQYAVADANAFAGEIRKQQTKLNAFTSVEVVSLTDRDATKANILMALSILAGSASAETSKLLAPLKAARPADAVFIYFAGHGMARGSRFYLIPHDLAYTGRRLEARPVDIDNVLARSLSDEELEKAFEKLDSERLILIIDACNSGQALEAEEKRRGPMNSKGLAQLAYEKGMYILAAAQGYQAALEASHLGHGYLTYALVEEGLKTPAADGAPPDGQIVLREWLDYATHRVPAMQSSKMEESRKQGRELAFVEGEELLRDLSNRSLQRPRVFYRREPEREPLVVAKPGGAGAMN